MRKEILITADGSATIFLPEWNEYYHSKFGAVQESIHVFIKNGLNHLKDDKISILEVGFGTGLNALLTFIYGQNFRSIHYLALENNPMPWEYIKQLKYPEYLRLNTELNGYFAKMHQSPWNSEITLSNNFILHKSFLDIKDFRTPDKFNLIYFDAFAPAIQPELWEEDVFRKLSDALLPKGLLVTYCAKGEFRRSLQQIGFEVERLPGPPGKREMIRAILKSD